MVDLHAHVLPGLDDGPRSMAEAVEMCRLAAADGTRALVATPHVMKGVYDVTREQILDGVRRLAEALSREKVGLRVLPGADIHADADLLEAARAGELMTVADGGRYVMIELDGQHLPSGVEQLFFALQLRGLTPILSHPERNVEVQRNPGPLERLVRGGLVTQITAGSLTGLFGEASARCARHLLKRNLAHLVASDAHSCARRPPGLSEARREVRRLVGEATATQIFESRPEAVLAGRPLELPEPI